jgi:uncharacterized protein YcaQ
MARAAKTPIGLSKKEARRIILAAQGLNKSHPFGSGPSGVSQVITHLGYVQIDTISVVERAHHHVLWTRLPSYKTEWIEQVQRKDRTVFEYWAHAAAYLPMQDYRFSIPVMEAFRSKKDRWPKSQQSEMKKVLARIREEGAVMSRHFESNHKGGSWWDWKPAKWALQRLFLEGRLMVSHRENFQRVYDLPERILPDHVDTSTPDWRAYYTYLILNTLKAQGIASRNELFHLRHIDHKKFDRVMEELTLSEAIVPVQVEGSKQLYSLSGWLNQSIRMTDRISFLSPFDNTIIWRNRIRDIFDFDYTLECYLPEHKRVYGYFCLPILKKDEFIGRADMKADRKSGILEVKKLFWTNKGASGEVQEALDAALLRFATFNQCNTVRQRKS